ncbi:GLIPR1 protein 1 [Echinococcus multilocularis]|uniref:GLIPR1 protein 1 n=1 Tax=Echinococcus multilocularis TaxID=6211 RepID=A0A068YBI2_ECHMU|nr:GLIPR1 protein 1 [Echinococcus multilocularis]
MGMVLSALTLKRAAVSMLLNYTMIKFICALVLITLVASEAPTEQERRDLLNFHNGKRRSVNPSAANMLEMVYSKELENLAVEWVARCKFEHPNWKEYPAYRGIGQNLALSGGSRRNLVAQATGWWNEVAYYTYANNTCASGKVCGHYTQLVWASSGELGCAVQRCDDIKPDWPKPIFLMACQYKPPGNYAGEKPYTSGTSCSKCPNGTTCVNKLCSKGGSQTTSTPSTSPITQVGGMALFATILVYAFA